MFRRYASPWLMLVLLPALVLLAAPGCRETATNGGPAADAGPQDDADDKAANGSPEADGPEKSEKDQPADDGGKQGPAEEEANGEPPDEAPPADDEPGEEPSAGEKVGVTVADAEAYEMLLKEHRGKVVLVDFWASWCIPCMKQFPHTVEMHEKYGDKGLAVISVSLDDPEDRETVTNFLTKQEAAFDNLLSATGGSEKAFEGFDIPNGLPHYKVYDRQGKLRETFSVDADAEEQFTHEDIEAAVKKVLAEKEADEGAEE